MLRNIAYSDDPEDRALFEHVVDCMWATERYEPTTIRGDIFLYYLEVIKPIVGAAVTLVSYGNYYTYDPDAKHYQAPWVFKGMASIEDVQKYARAHPGEHPGRGDED